MAPRLPRYVVDERGLTRYLMFSRPLQKVVQRRANVVRDVAKAFAPSSTRPGGPAGSLEQSIHTVPGLVSRRPFWGPRYGVQVRTGVVYGAAAETGRKKYAPYGGVPFMGPVAKLLNTPKRNRKI